MQVDMPTGQGRARAGGLAGPAAGLAGMLILAMAILALACEAPAPHVRIATLEPAAGSLAESDLALRTSLAGRDRMLTIARGNLGSPHWAPGAERLAWLEYLTARGDFGFTLVLADPDGRRAVRHPIAGAPGAMAWSPEGRRLAVLSGLEDGGTARLRIFSADGRLTDAVVLGAADVFGGGFVAWSPDRRQLLTEVLGDLFLVRPGEGPRRLPAPPVPGGQPATQVFRPFGWAGEATVAGAWYFPGNPDGRPPEAMTLDARAPGTGWQRAPAQDRLVSLEATLRELAAGPAEAFCRDAACTFAGWTEAGPAVSRAEESGTTIYVPAAGKRAMFRHAPAGGEALAGVTFDVAIDR